MVHDIMATWSLVFHTDAAGIVRGHKMSTVVPGSVTGETIHDLSALDWAMRLNYVRGVYYFRRSDAVSDLTVWALKQPMFPWLDMYNPICGRITMPAAGDAGLPTIKCNDCGVRILEAVADETLDEWLAGGEPGRWKVLTSDKTLAKDARFSPLVYLQFTKFKCGAMAVGISWSHVLGNAAAAALCLNKYGQFISGDTPSVPVHVQANCYAAGDVAAPRSARLAKPDGEAWLPPVSRKMVAFSLGIPQSITAKNPAGAFETICAAVWRAVAHVRADKDLRSVTVIKNAAGGGDGGLGNAHRIYSLTVESSPAKTDAGELAAKLRGGDLVDETAAVARLAETAWLEDGHGVLVYGVNLTFVDMQDVGVHEFEIKGQRPAHVEYGVDGVGEEGAVIVLPDGAGGRSVSLTLPVEEVDAVGRALRASWSI